MGFNIKLIKSTISQNKWGNFKDKTWGDLLNYTYEDFLIYTLNQQSNK